MVFCSTLSSFLLGFVMCELQCWQSKTSHNRSDRTASCRAGATNRATPILHGRTHFRSLKQDTLGGYTMMVGITKNSFVSVNYEKTCKIKWVESMLAGYGREVFHVLLERRLKIRQSRKLQWPGSNQSMPEVRCKFAQLWSWKAQQHLARSFWLDRISFVFSKPHHGNYALHVKGWA